MLRKALVILSVIIGIGLLTSAFKFVGKYSKADTMTIAINEISTSDYPEDPSHRSVLYDRYAGRQLRLVKVDDTHFDFNFESKAPAVANVSIKNVDIGLFVPRRPDWTSSDENLEVIALVDREWNRQQVRFPAKSGNIQVDGGDGFEVTRLHTVELARNCLNAGLWEIILTTIEDGRKAVYYQGWFNFPLGHYKDLFEKLNNVSYWTHWYRLEHWINPHGRHVELKKLRTVLDEREIAVVRQADEHLIVAGEQLRKARTTNAKNVRCWGDFCAMRDEVRFASFRPPGRYSVNHPWANEFNRISRLERSVLRTVRPAASDERLEEIELVFKDDRNGQLSRFLVSGVNLSTLPQLEPMDYPKGLYMPMGIGVPPFYQSYEELEANPPHKSPYFSVLIDENDRWINHHEVAIDGPVMHRDLDNPNILHLYFLSYERHSLVGHYVITLGGQGKSRLLSN